MPRKPIELRWAVLGKHEKEAAYIAEIIAGWNTIEHSTYRILGLLMRTKVDHARALLSAAVSSKVRLEIIASVGASELKDAPALLIEFQTIIKSLASRLKARNEYAHGLYVLNSKHQLCILHRRYELPLHAGQMRVIYPRALLQESGLANKVLSQSLKFYQKLWDRLPVETQRALLKTIAPLTPPPLSSKE